MTKRRRDEPEPEEHDPVYLPGASATEPSVTYLTGWPQRIICTEGDQSVEYWRLRDGSGVNGGGAVLYGLIVDDSGQKPIVEGEHRYVPTMPSKTVDTVTMSGGIWYAAPDLEPTFIRRLP